MRNINKVILIGNIAREPDVRTTAGGQKMATFVLATNRTWHDPQGQKQSQAEFHNMLAWGKIAEICEKFLQKSTLVYVEGYLKTRSWEHETGVRLYRTEIVIQDILVLDRGIQHNDTNDNDYEPQSNSNNYYEENDLFEEKPAQEIEKSFQNKLSQGNDTVADISSTKPSSSEKNAISLDEPLFEEEAK